jgi:hypothetical protein
MRNEEGEGKEKKGKERKRKRSQLGRVTTHKYIKY